MPLAPQDIVRREFREAFRGYNQADVDLFLDEVVEELTRLVEENQKMRVRLAALQQDVARLREGRGVAPAQPQPGAPAPAASRRADSEQVEAEVRARLRRFFEDQLRALEAGGTLSPTAARVARELVQQPIPAPPAAEPAPRKDADAREPFWAGE